MGWQKSSGYHLRARMEASITRYQRMIADALRSRTDRTEATEVAIAAAALKKMRRLGRPNCIRIASVKNLPASEFGPMASVQHRRYPTHV